MPSPAPDASGSYFANAPPGLVSTAVGAPAAARPSDDYAWTHGVPAEGFFAIVTAIAVPVAILRWARRLGIARRLARS